MKKNGDECFYLIKKRKNFDFYNSLQETYDYES